MKKLLRFLALFFVPALASSFALGQGGFIPPQTAFKNINGIVMPIAGATVTVCGPNASGIPCAPVLVNTIFKDGALTQSLSNPFPADPNGNYQFAAAPGTYTVTTSAAGFAGNSYQFTIATGSSLGASVLTLNPTMLAFGTVKVGNQVQQTVTVCGGTGGSKCPTPNPAPVTISAVNVTDTLDATNPFTQSNNCVGVIQPGQSCTITVTFSPSNPLPTSGIYCNATPDPCNLVITSSASGSPQSVPLSGTGSAVSVPTLTSIALTPVSPTINTNSPGVQLVSTGTYSDTSQKILTNVTQFSASGNQGTVNEALANTPNANNSDCNYQTTSSARSCPAMSVTAGQVGVCEFYSGVNDNTDPTITDSQNNTWTLLTSTKGNVNGQAETLGIWKTVFGTTGSVTITANSGTGLNIASIGLGCAAFSGLSGTVDVSGSVASAAGAANMSTGNFTTNGTDVVFCAFVDRGNQVTMTPTGNFNTQLGQSSPKYASMQSYAVNKAQGTYSCTGTEAGGPFNTWIAGYVAFLPSGGGTGAQIASVGSNPCQTPPLGPSTQGCAPGNAPGLVLGLAPSPPNSTIAANSGLQTGNFGSCSPTGSGIASVTCALNQPVSANQTVVVKVSAHDTSSTFSNASVTDTSSNSYLTGCTRTPGTGLQQGVYYSQLVPASTALNVTVAFGGGGATNPEVQIAILDGLLTAGGLDGSCVSTATSTVSSSATVTTSNQFDTVFFGSTGSGPINNLFPVNIATSEGAFITNSSLGAVMAWFDTFVAAGGSYTGTSNYQAAGNAITQILAFSANGATDAVTVNSGSQTPYTALSQQPTNLEFGPSWIFATALPTSGNFSKTHYLTNSDAIVLNLYQNSDQNSGNTSQVTCISSTAGGDTCNSKDVWWYSGPSDPVYCVTGIGRVPSQPANNPMGKCFHLTSGASWSANTLDQYFHDIDYSCDLDSNCPRILSDYEFCSGNCPLQLNPACTCTTAQCGQNTPACHLVLGTTDYNHPFNDPLGGIQDGVVWNINAGSGSMVTRMAEVQSNQLLHAIQIGFPCANSIISFPSSGGGFNCANQTNTVSVGALFTIDAAYNCGALPVWQQPGCTALQTYGGYASPTESGTYAGDPGMRISNFESPIPEFAACPGLNCPGGGPNAPVFTNSTYTFLNFLNTFSGGPTSPVYCTGSPVTRCNAYYLVGMPGLITGDSGNGFKPHLHIVDPCVPRFMAGQNATCTGSPSD